MVVAGLATSAGAAASVALSLVSVVSLAVAPAFAGRAFAVPTGLASPFAALAGSVSTGLLFTGLASEEAASSDTILSETIASASRDAWSPAGTASDIAFFD